MAGFDDIKGQESVVEHFRNAIKLNKISHAYILNGEQGMGKKTAARAFAMTLMCEKKGEVPCMECHSCKQAASNNHPDIKWITHEKPAVISVEEIRSQINGDVQIKPYSSQYKIYIMDEADKMNQASQNALLKTIEEPPSYVIIMLLTCNKNLLLETIHSRCVAMEMRPVKKDIIEKYLMENVGIVDYRARQTADFAGGNIGKAIKMASSDDFSDLKDSVINLTKTIGKMSAADINSSVKEIGEYKDNISEYMDLLLAWYRDVLLYKAGQKADRLLFCDHIKAVREQAEKLEYGSIEKILREIDGVKGKLRVNVNFDMVTELLLLTMRDGFAGQ